MNFLHFCRTRQLYVWARGVELSSKCVQDEIASVFVLLHSIVVSWVKLPTMVKIQLVFELMLPFAKCFLTKQKYILTRHNEMKEMQFRFFRSAKFFSRFFFLFIYSSSLRHLLARLKSTRIQLHIAFIS